MQIFLILKEDAVSSSINSETETSVPALYPDTLVGPQRPHPWQTMSRVYNSFKIRMFQLFVRIVVPLTRLQRKVAQNGLAEPRWQLCRAGGDSLGMPQGRRLRRRNRVTLATVTYSL